MHPPPDPARKPHDGHSAQHRSRICVSCWHCVRNIQGLGKTLSLLHTAERAARIYNQIQPDMVPITDRPTITQQDLIFNISEAC